MKDILKLGFVLAAFACIACVALALVNNVTSPIIATAKEAEAKAAMQRVFPSADSFEEITDFSLDNIAPAKIEKMYIAKSQGEFIGSAVQMYAPTYAKAVVLVAVDMNRTIIGNIFLELTDTKGYGQKARENNYMDQYNGKTDADAFELDSDISAISGATITSRGLAHLMKAAAYAGGELLAQRCGGLAGGDFVGVVKGGQTFTVSQALADIFGVDAISTASIKNVTETMPIAFDTEDQTIEGIYTIAFDGEITGAAFEVSGKTFTRGSVLTVVDLGGTILGARIIDLQDTPSYGLRVLEEPTFYQQFTGKTIEDPLAGGEDIDILSGATITSNAIADLVRAGCIFGCIFLEENYDGKKTPSSVDHYKLHN